MLNKFSVIGHPMGHTMSPFIHKRLFEISDIQVDYSVEDIRPCDLESKMNFLKTLGGFNITIPHKQTIIPLLDCLDESAIKYSAVNCVSMVNGKSIGYNTDAFGFLAALKSGGLKLKGNVVIAGCGGVARTMAKEAVLADCHVTLGVIPRSMTVAESLCAELNSICKESCRIQFLDKIENKFDLAINATPLGMYPKVGAMPLTTNQLKNCSSVFDAVYNPHETLLLKTAKKLGIKAIGGMSMLVWQAAAAHKYWYNAEFNTSDIEKLIDDSITEMQRLFHEKITRKV